MDVAGQAHRVLLLDDILSRAQIDLKTKPIGQALLDRRRIGVECSRARHPPNGEREILERIRVILGGDNRLVLDDDYQSRGDYRYEPSGQC